MKKECGICHAELPDVDVAEVHFVKLQSGIKVGADIHKTNHYERQVCDDCYKILVEMVGGRRDEMGRRTVE